MDFEFHPKTPRPKPDDWWGKPEGNPDTPLSESAVSRDNPKPEIAKNGGRE